MWWCKVLQAGRCSKVVAGFGALGFSQVAGFSGVCGCDGLSLGLLGLTKVYMIYMDTLTKVYMIYMDTDPLGLPSALFGAEPISLQKPSALFGAEPISLQKTWMQSEDLDAKSVKLRKFWLEQSVQSLNMVLSESFGVNNGYNRSVF